MKLYISVTPIKASKGWFRKKHYWDICSITASSDNSPIKFTATYHNKEYNKRYVKTACSLIDVFHQIKMQFHISNWADVSFVYAGHVATLAIEITAIQNALCQCDISELFHYDVISRMEYLTLAVPDSMFGFDSPFSLILDKSDTGKYTTAQKAQMIRTHDDYPEIFPSDPTSTVLWIRSMDIFLDKIEKEITDGIYNKETTGSL